MSSALLLDNITQSTQFLVLFFNHISSYRKFSINKSLLIRKSEFSFLSIVGCKWDSGTKDHKLAQANACSYSTLPNPFKS